MLKWVFIKGTWLTIVVYLGIKTVDDRKPIEERRGGWICIPQNYFVKLLDLKRLTVLLCLIYTKYSRVSILIQLFYTQNYYLLQNLLCVSLIILLHKNQYCFIFPFDALGIYKGRFFIHSSYQFVHLLHFFGLPASS